MSSERRNDIGTLVSFGDAIEFRNYLAGQLDLKHYAKADGERSEEPVALVRPEVPRALSANDSKPSGE